LRRRRSFRSAASPLQRFALDAGRREVIAEPSSPSHAPAFRCRHGLGTGWLSRDCAAVSAWPRPHFGCGLQSPVVTRGPRWSRTSDPWPDGPAGDGPCGLAVRFSMGSWAPFHVWIVAVSWPCIAGPARMLATTDTRWVSRDRPDGAPLMRFRPLQRSPATPRLIMVQPCHGSGRCRFDVRRPAPAPRVRPALPRPIRSPMRFFAHRPRRDSRPESAGIPVNRGQRRSGSCAASSFIGGDVPLPAPNRVARPGLSFVSRRRSWGSSLRSVAPARAASGTLSVPS
jgi:hypothetical protein